MKCLNCGTENNITNLQCTNCNHFLVPQDEVKDNLEIKKEITKAELRAEKLQLRIATVRFNLYVLSGLFVVYIILNVYINHNEEKINIFLELATWYHISLACLFFFFARYIDEKPKEITYSSTVIYSLLLLNNIFRLVPEIFVGFFIPLVNLVIHAGILLSFTKAIMVIEKSKNKTDTEILDA